MRLWTPERDQFVSPSNGSVVMDLRRVTGHTEYGTFPIILTPRYARHLASLKISDASLAPIGWFKTSKARLLPVPEPECLPTPVRDPATIDNQGMPVDEAAFFGVSKKPNSVRHVVRCGESRHRYTAGDITVRVSAPGLVGDIHFRFYPTRTHRVNTNPAATPLD